MKKLTKEQFNYLKDALYAAQNGLDRSFKTCPELVDYSITLSGGQKLSGLDVVEWLEAARAGCWKFGPREVRQRKLKQAMKQQPRG